MDDPVLQEQLAAFRYSLIAPIVSRQTPMLPGELTRQLQEIASRSYTIPGSRKTAVSVRSLERYIAGYRKNGWEGLKPRPRSQEEQPQHCAGRAAESHRSQKGTPGAQRRATDLPA